jgi:O-methyltransferase
VTHADWTEATLQSPMTAAEAEILHRVQPYTMTSPERVIATLRAVDHIVANGIGGDLVECGVWRGGSMMAMAYSLLRHAEVDRTLYLYDTFSGMPAPTSRDIQFDGVPAALLLASSARDTHIWAFATLDEVRRNLEATGYPIDKVRFIAGPVEETIPRTIPDAISILRLDTDWYESTRHELVHLYPLLSERGILIVDDYGHWRGSREATDEYFARIGSPPYLHRIDYTGVLAVKRGRTPSEGPAVRRRPEP